MEAPSIVALPEALSRFVVRCQSLAGHTTETLEEVVEMLRQAVAELPTLPAPERFMVSGLMMHTIVMLFPWHFGSSTCSVDGPPEGHAELLVMLETFARLPHVPAVLRPSVHPRAQGALEYITVHFQNPRLSLGHVARHVGMSHCHLARLLKKETGRGFLWHLHTARIDASKMLLDTSLRSVKEVAGAVGYNDSTQFCRHFRRRCGTTPRFYRNARERTAYQ